VFKLVVGDAANGSRGNIKELELIDLFFYRFIFLDPVLLLVSFYFIHANNLNNKYSLSALNLCYVTLKFRIVAIFVIVDSQTTFCS
jgi:hypothetical protein